MLSREHAITRLNAYGVPFSEEKWQSETVRKHGEFGVFAIIIRIIAGLFILGMVIVSIAGFIALLGLDNSWQHVSGGIGILATGFAAWKFRHSYKSLERQYSFKGLLYLSLLLVGKACLLAALFGWFDTNLFVADRGWIVAVIFSLITLVSCLYYRMYLEAFLGVLVSLALLDRAIEELLRLWMMTGVGETTTPKQGASYYYDLNIVPMSDVLTVCLLLGFGAFLVWRQTRSYLSSVYLYATLIFFGHNLLPSNLETMLFLVPGQKLEVSTNWSLALVCFAATLSLYTFLIGGWQKLKSLEHVIVICCMAILAVLGVYGVLFAVALMAMGNVRHDRVLWLIGLIYLPLYLIAFYYTLDETLLTKSYMLIGSGIALLAARYALLRFFAPSTAETDHA